MTNCNFTYVTDRIVKWINNLEKGHFGVPFWSMRIRQEIPIWHFCQIIDTIDDTKIACF